jgi:hypothetical protein
MAITFANRIYHYASVVALCAIVIGGVAFVFMTIQRMPAARAAFEQKLNAEDAEKSRAACEKWGMKASVQMEDGSVVPRTAADTARRPVAGEPVARRCRPRSGAHTRAPTSRSAQHKPPRPLSSRAGRRGAKTTRCPKPLRSVCRDDERGGEAADQVFFCRNWTTPAPR